MEKFEAGLLNELHEMNKHLRSINYTLSLLTVAVTSEDENESIKGGDTESNNKV